MGQWLSSLKGGEKAPTSIIIDFEAVEISPEFQAEILQKGVEVLHSIESYSSGAKEFVKRGMEATTDDERAEAFRGILPYIAQIKSYYDFSVLLGSKAVVNLVQNIVAAKNHIDSQKVQIKQLALILDFALRFDQQKMHTPQLLNDFSFYRRTFPRMASCPDIVVRDVEANKISMFMAHQVPMINCLCEIFHKHFEEKEAAAEVIEVLANMANILCAAIMQGFKDDATKVFCCRAMTGAIVLYDHVDPAGVFCAKSAVKLKACVKVLQDFDPPQKVLLDTIQYSSRHFKDKSTPAKIIKLFGP